MNGAERIELEAWLAADRRNRGAFLRAQAALHLAEEAVRQGPVLVSGNDSDYAIDRKPAHKRFGLASVAGFAMLAVMGMCIHAAINHEHASATQVMTLADGSIATLDKDARIEVDMSGGMRHVTLVSGKASFKVFHDKTHPFIVQSGNVFAQATGTEYSVSRVGKTGSTVDVSEGSVLVWAGDERDQTVLLHAGGKLTLDPGAASARAALPAPDVAQISLDNETIAAAVARFNRVNRTQLMVEPSIGQTRIVGQFRADNPEQFARAAAVITGARVVHRDGIIVITDQRQ